MIGAICGIIGAVTGIIGTAIAVSSHLLAKKATEPQVIIYTDHFYTATTDGEGLYLKNYIIIQNYGSVSATITDITYDNNDLVSEHIEILTTLKGITLAPNQCIKSEFPYEYIDSPIDGTIKYSWEKQKRTHSSQFLIDTKVAKSIKVLTMRVRKGKKVSLPVIDKTTE